MNIGLDSLSSDPLIYFLLHSTVLVLVTAAVFLFLGLWLGWLAWAKYKRQRNDLIHECELLKGDVAQLKRKLAEQATRAAVPGSAASEPQAQPPSVSIEPDPVVGSFLATAAALLAPAKVESAAPSSPPPGSSPPIQSASASPLTAPLTEPSSDKLKAFIPPKTKPRKNVLQSVIVGSEASPPPEPAKRQRTARATLETNLATPPATKLAPAAKSAELPPLPSVPHDELLPGMEAPAEAPPNGSAVTGEHGARLMCDPHLGLVYENPPAQFDDLTHLKGVAAIIEGKLHEFGVYTFKQIALWNDENIHEFSSRLAFKDRIVRERWVEQARELHFQKYAERL